MGRHFLSAWALALAAAFLGLSGAASAQDKQELPRELVEAAQSLTPEHGKVTIEAAHATLDLGTAYDFYDREDAKKILVDIWGNPPESATNVLGLVMPAGASPLSDSWGAVVTYDNSGYVSDEDATEVDYGELLSSMQDGEDERNAARKEAGYPAIHLAGWAEQPKYDKATHSVVWAQDIAFADTPNHTLNYDVRTLGRLGVLSLNLISSLDKLGEVRGAARAFTAHASFDEGFRYQDFDPSLDKKAEYGIGGLIAAGVGVAAAKKLGILAILLKFLKPIAIAVIAGFAFLRKRIARLFGMGGEEPVADWDYAESEAEPAAEELPTEPVEPGKG